MARLPRLTLPGYAHHVLQRGNNRQLVFTDPDDFATMARLLLESARKFQVSVHAYVFMPNHFHLLATPAVATALPQLMQAIGRSYVRYFNDRHGRFGTLWEGRYRSTVLQAEPYLLPCMAYIDLNPVRAGLALEAQDYSWSSYRHYAGFKTDALVTPHPLFWALDNTPFGREAAYTRIVRQGIGPLESEQLTRSVISGWPIGTAEFASELQLRAERRVVKAHAGRPAKPNH